MEKEKVYAGIDVAKKSLDIAIHDTGQQWSFLNDDTGISTAVNHLKEFGSSACGIGGYWRHRIANYRGSGRG